MNTTKFDVNVAMIIFCDEGEGEGDGDGDESDLSADISVPCN
jgi:hypothetical protein